MSNDSRLDDSTTLRELHSVPPTLTRNRAISVSVDPVALVVTECITVTSAMRKHARWAHSSVSAILGGGATRELPIHTSGRGGRTSASSTTSPADDALAGRWGLRGKKGKSMQDNPLILAFARLRSDLKGCKDIRSFDTPSLLHPFLQVIRSSSTSAPITSLALIAITKFLSYNIVCQDSPRLALAMQLLSSAITHCRFEATNTSADEVVLLRILKLMEGMISGPGGDILGDESVCEMMETGLSMCCQIRLSEVLQRSAEISMVSMCQVIFERLKHLAFEAGDEPGALEESTKDDMDAVKMDPSINGDAMLSVPGSKPEEGRSSTSMEKDSSDDAPVPNANGSTLELPRPSDEEEPQVIKPYSLPSIRELFRVLVDLLDPEDRQHTDTMRIMALRIVDVALEVAGPSIASHPSLASLAKDTLCRHLFQLVRSENMAILNESLRVAYTLLATCRGVLKLQQELFLSYLVACLFPRVDIPQEPGIEPSVYEGVPQAPSLVKPSPAPSGTTSGRSTPVPVKDRQKLGLEGGSRRPDAREAMVESVGALVRIPSFMVELFINYDCDVNRSDLCMDMVGLLARNAFPDSATWSTTNVPPLCLDALLGYVQLIADRLDDEPVKDGYPTVEELKQQRARKKIIIRGATKFNENPKAGIAFLASQGIIEDIKNPRHVAEFLRATTRIDKKVLGEYISKRSNEEILSAFMESFDFTGQRVDEALRQLLNSFRLPGESQLIERIVTDFAEKYCANDTPEGIADKDAVYVLTYAIIMLNTDQHNPNLKKNRMRVEDFARNLRGVNGGQDFPQDYLQDIYNSIKTREIILPEEHDNKHAYDHAWKELLTKIQSADDLVISDTNIFDAEMFAATWKPIVATLSFVFLSASDEAVFSRVVAGFVQCAEIAARHGLHDCMDRIVYCLSYISTLAPEVPPSTTLNTEVQADKESEKIMVSETAVRFGRDDKAQLATVLLFRVVNGNEATIREGWSHIVRIVLNLFINSLIPSSFASIPSSMELSPIPLQNPAQIIDREQRQNESSLFSSFASSIFSFANDEPPEPSDQEIEFTLCTIDCLASCGFPEVFANISKMPVETLHSLIQTLLSQIPEDSSPRLIVVKPELPAPSPLRPNGSKAKPKGVVYDPSLVFVLELATVLVMRNAEAVEALGKDVGDALQAVIRDASNVHPVVLSRAIYYLLNILRASNDHDFIRAPVVLHAISSFPQETLSQVSLPLLKGLAECINGPVSLRNELVNSPDFWSILRSLHGLPEAAPEVFKILEEVVGGTPPSVSADNYEATLEVLNDFASAGSVGSAEEKRMDRAGKGVKGAKGKRTQTNDVVLRGSKAMSIVYQLTSRVPHFIEQSQLETVEAWNAYWSPIFKILTNQCLNPCREIRSQALTSLQRCLLSNDIVSPSHKEWTAIFSEVLFPLINQLLRPEVYQSDPVGMAETRVQAATLLCKVFLHYLVALSEWEGMLDLWLKILGIMDRLMNSGQGDNLEEAVPESLKNILLVMSSGGYLAPPDQKPEQEELWRETWKKLDRFLPNLFTELFPEEAGKPLQTSPTKKTQEAPVEQVSGAKEAAATEMEGVAQPAEGDGEIGGANAEAEMSKEAES
ncbi:Sec7-domain-containing protein [Saccharata proteae CBS 121410]|uniref:Sec7-domain-containing protein n=1 Tax=Saccharata proteae CBS 121410 TaxID=1314787 RepID=A0A9P4HN18_9PEZI|nr:Sec7-domain-containing protein [Saccharata proteae CBS 121410]